MAVIYRCLSTLLICTWVAVHPNIPPRGDGRIRVLWRRLKLMLWTLVAPELILLWAYRQWAAARYIAGLFKDEGWTATHGHFLIMGGFSLVRNDDETPLDYESFFELLEIDTATSLKRTRGNKMHTPSFEEPFQIALPTLSAAEIKDKGRGDFLSKLVAVLQTTWFIAQCRARYSQGLALTEVELVTLALASLLGMMYFFWWDKPLGVQEPIKVYPVGEDPAWKVFEGAGLSFDASLQANSQLSIPQGFFLRPLRQMHSSISQFVRHLPSILSGHKFLFLYLPIYWFIHLPVTALTESLLDIATTTDVRPHARHVPTFYAPPIESSVDSQTVILLAFVLSIVATFLGALHLIACQFLALHQQQILWRIGTLAITVIPSASLFIAILINAFPTLLGTIFGPRPSKRFERIMVTMPEIVRTFLMRAGLVGYLLPRFLLLSQAVGDLMSNRK